MMGLSSTHLMAIQVRARDVTHATFHVCTYVYSPCVSNRCFAL
jgi:hypothetical protein